MITGSYFGEVEIIELAHRYFRCDTDSHCEMYSMTRNVFPTIKSRFPAIFDEMIELSRKRKANNETNIKKLICMIE